MSDKRDAMKTAERTFAAALTAERKKTMNKAIEIVKRYGRQAGFSSGHPVDNAIGRLEEARDHDE